MDSNDRRVCHLEEGHTLRLVMGHSTVTDFARLRGMSTSSPFFTAT